jgi:arylsulfatase
VPAFWRWQGSLPAGIDIPALVGHIDMFPTFAALANAELPKNQVEGRSLLPLLTAKDAVWEDRFLFTHVGRWAKGSDPNLAKFSKCAIRTQRFRLVNNNELYDLVTDPFEKINVIEQFPAEVTAMRAAYDLWWTKAVPMMVNEAVPNLSHRPYWDLYEEQVKNGGIPAWINPTF